MAEASGEMLQAIVQYGFAGFAGVQLIIIVWMINRVMTAFDRNTTAYMRLTSMLNARPCLRGDREFFNNENEN
jgi:hypothetical protein